MAGLAATPKPAARRVARPRHSRLRDAGGMFVMAVQVLIALVTPPFIWVRPFLNECISVLRIALLPMVFAIVVYCFGGPGIQAGAFFTELGSVDRMPSGYIIGSIRDLGVFTIATYMAGIYGTQVTAELGSRKITDELAALESLAIDPFRALVVPRVLAMAVMLSLFTVLIIVVGTLGGYAAGTILYTATPAAFFDSLLLNLRPIDILQGYVRALAIGFPMGVLFCYRGMKVEGGPAGVGRAVNQSIVGGMLVIFSVSVAFSLMIQAFFPELSAIR